MRFTSRVFGAMATILVAGVAGGAIIGDVPPVKRLERQDLLPQAGTIEIDYRQDRNLPDHYPLVTPQGRVEIHELAERGLYSQARYAPHPYDEYDAELAYAELDAAYAAEPDDQPAEEFPVAAQAGEMVEVEPATIPERRHEAPPPEGGSASAAPAVASVTLRAIDVRKELPARY